MVVHCVDDYVECGDGVVVYCDRVADVSDVDDCDDVDSCGCGNAV